MANVDVKRFDAASGWLPAVCPKHGFPADRSVKRTFWNKSSGWIAAFIIACILLRSALFWVGFIAALVTQKHESFQLPGCSSCVASARRTRQIRWTLGLGAVGALAVAAVTASAALMAIGGVLALIALVACSSVLESRGAVPGNIDAEYLHLKRVHPAFINALQPNPWSNSLVPHTPYGSPHSGPLPPPTNWGSVSPAPAQAWHTDGVPIVPGWGSSATQWRPPEG